MSSIRTVQKLSCISVSQDAGAEYVMLVAFDFESIIVLRSAILASSYPFNLSISMMFGSKITNGIQSIEEENKKQAARITIQMR